MMEATTMIILPGNNIVNLVNTENEWSYLNECCINKQIANRDTINV